MPKRKDVKYKSWEISDLHIPNLYFQNSTVNFNIFFAHQQRISSLSLRSYLRKIEYLRSLGFYHLTKLDNLYNK